MKITRTTPLSAIQPPKSGTERPSGSESPKVGSDKVTLSPDAAFVERARDSVRAEEVRTDVVDEVKAQLAAGTFEKSVDMDATVSSLLADL